MKDYFGYAMGDFGCNMCFALITNYMMLFYTQYIGVSLGDWAWIIIVGKVWDAINDVLIGNMVDNMQISKKSKFKPWIVMGGAALIVCTTLTFLPLTEASYRFKVFYCLMAYCVWSVAYTLANVPYGALHSSITDEPDKRTNLSTFRSIGAGLAQAPLMLLPLVVYDESDNLKGKTMFWIALGCSLIGFVGFLLVKFLVTERITVEKKNEKSNYLRTVKNFFSNVPMVALTIVSFVQVVCFMSMQSVNNIIFQSYFHNTKILAAVNIVAYLPMVLVMPFVGKITKKIGKKKFIVLSSAISAVAGVTVFLLPLEPAAKSSIPIWIAGLMLLYFSNAVFSVIVWAMVVDCIDWQYIKTGNRDEGSTYALYSFFRKLAQGAGSAISALALALCGYVEELGAAQSAETALNVKNMYLIVMTVGVVISVVVTQFMYKTPEGAPSIHSAE